MLQKIETAECGKPQLAESVIVCESGQRPSCVVSSVTPATLVQHRGVKRLGCTNPSAVGPTGLPQPGGGSDAPASMLAVPAARLSSLSPILEENGAPTLDLKESSLMPSHRSLHEENGALRRVE